MRAWMLPWLLPVGVLTAVALISLSNAIGYVLALLWGWVLFPHGAAYLRSHSRSSGASDDETPWREDDTDYWRTKLL